MNLVRWGAAVAVVLVFLFLAIRAVSAFLYHAKTFAIRTVSIAEDLGDISLPDFEKMKGKNVFSVDLTKIEEKIRTKYPRLGGVRVVRRFPDDIFIAGFKREPVAVVSVGGRASVVSRDGFLMGAPNEEMAGLPLIKGLKFSQTGAGAPVEDERLAFSFSIIDALNKEGGVSALGFRVLDIHDAERIVCGFGQGKEAFEIFLDGNRALAGLQAFFGMMGRMNLDFSTIKYIDLRFDQPVIGQKKIKK